MTLVSPGQIKALREASGGVSIAQCREALVAANGDAAAALARLRETAAAQAAKKADRALGAGYIHAYIHGAGAVGALVEVRAETDFVARHDGFRQLAEDLAMQIAATAPTTTEEILTQPFIKDEKRTIGDLLLAAAQKFGERVELTRFARFSVVE